MPKTKIITGVSEYAIAVDDDYLLVDSSTGPVTLFLPKIRDNWKNVSEKTFFIVDRNKKANINPISLKGSGNTVNSGSVVIMNESGMSAACKISGLENWVIGLQSESGIPSSQIAYSNEEALPATNIKEALDELFSSKITISATPPPEPYLNQLWIQT